MTIHESGPSWFLAQLKPNSVKIAERNLSRQGFQTFLPLEAQTRRSSGAFTTGLRPLFPGYIFVAFDVTKGLWKSVNSTSGITRLVSFGQTPAMVPDELVSKLRLRCDSDGRVLPPKHLTPGDQVALTTGPFASFVAEVEQIAPDQRVWVLLEIMGGKTRVAVEPEQLRAV